MKRLLLVFDSGDGAEPDLQKFVDSLDTGARMYTMDGSACFIVSTLSASEISDRFLEIAGSRLFFVSDVTSSPSAGRMLGAFWDFMKNPVLSNAAE